MRTLKISAEASIAMTHMRGYLFISEGEEPYDKGRYMHVYGHCIFEDIVNAIAKLGKDYGQCVFAMADGDKSSFCLIGTFFGEPFTLYDWKNDRCVHIGGTARLDVERLKIALFRVLRPRLKKLN